MAITRSCSSMAAWIFGSSLSPPANSRESAHTRTPTRSSTCWRLLTTSSSLLECEIKTPGMQGPNGYSALRQPFVTQFPHLRRSCLQAIPENLLHVALTVENCDDLQRFRLRPVNDQV